MKVEKSNIITILIILITILLMGYYTFSVISERRELEKKNNPAMKALSESVDSAKYTNLQGEPTSLEDFVGEVLVVNSWASWSPHSATELPALVDLVSDYEEYGVKVIAINRAEPAVTAVRFLKSINVNDRVTLILDPEDRFYKSIEGYSMPETVIFDKDGNIFYQVRGVFNPEKLKAKLDELLKS